MNVGILNFDKSAELLTIDSICEAYIFVHSCENP